METQACQSYDQRTARKTGQANIFGFSCSFFYLYATLIKKVNKVFQRPGVGEGIPELQLGLRGAGRIEEGQEEQACAPPASGGTDISPAREVG